MKHAEISMQCAELSMHMVFVEMLGEIATGFAEQTRILISALVV
jgi:hypothetical protein